MPYYDLVTGIKYYKDDACRNCSVNDLCNVPKDLIHDRQDSKYNEIHIVPKGQSRDQKDYVECMSYVPYVSMQDRPDPDPGFGLRIDSEQHALRRDNPFN